MAKKRPPAGLRETLETKSATWTWQRTSSGENVFRKNGRYTSEAKFHAASLRKTTKIVEHQFDRAYHKGARRSPSTVWVREDSKTKFGRAGELASRVIPGLRAGQALTEQQRNALFADMRATHGFESYWAKFPKMSRDEAERKFAEMLKKLSRLRNAQDRDDVREEYGLDSYEETYG